jgi:nucleotide-binding universal stress UspA family protein
VIVPIAPGASSAHSLISLEIAVRHSIAGSAAEGDMKNILLLVHSDEGQEARLQAALDLTRALEGHLTCLDVVQFPVFGPDYFPTPGQAFLLEDERVAEADNRTGLEARLRFEDVSWNMVESIGDIADCVSQASGLADVIVLNRKLDVFSSVNMLGVATSVALRSGKPIVAVSESARGFDAAGAALVAWDGSKPAMAALEAAVPLLRLARTVEIFEAGDGRPNRAEEAAAYLSRYDIHPTITRGASTELEVAEQIQQACAAAGAGYCVMGAFGHSPLRETLLGGVTRAMLTTSEIPLFLAH